MGPVYLATAIVLGGVFVYRALRLWREPAPARAWGLFKYSIVYLAALFGASRSTRSPRSDAEPAGRHGRLRQHLVDDADSCAGVGLPVTDHRIGAGSSTRRCRAARRTRSRPPRRPVRPTTLGYGTPNSFTQAPPAAMSSR